MNLNNDMRTVLTRGVIATAAAVAVLAAPVPASAKVKYKLSFQKDCPEFTCTGTLLDRSGAEIPGSAVATTLTPLWFEGGVLGYAAEETISRGDSAFTMGLVGTFNYNAEPDSTQVLGSVISGSWLGQPLTGALVEGTAERVSGSIIAGVLTIRPQR